MGRTPGRCRHLGLSDATPEGPPSPGPLPRRPRRPSSSSPPALPSIGLARLAGLGNDGVPSAGRRRSWVGVLVAVVGLMLAVAMPLSLIIGVPVGRCPSRRGCRSSLPSSLSSRSRSSGWAPPLAGSSTLAIEFLRSIAGGRATDTGGVIGGPLVDWQGMLGSEGQNGLALGVIPLVVAIVVVFILIRALVRRPRRLVVDGEVVEDPRSRASDRDASESSTGPDAATARRPALRERGRTWQASSVLARSARVRAPRVRDAGRARRSHPGGRSERRSGSWPRTTHWPNSGSAP